MTSVYERLKNLQITLPDVPPPVVDGYVAAFVPFVRTGNLIYLSGRLAKKNGKLWCGKLGGEITTAEGKQAARSVAIELFATLQAAIGDLNDVRRIVKLLVFVNSGPHFTEPYVVANGASELFIEVFEERGAHARSALGVSQIPFGCRATYYEERNHIFLSILPSSRARLQKFLGQLPAAIPLALRTQPDPRAHACLVWRPGQEQPMAITPTDSDGSTKTGAFLAFVPDQETNEIRMVEDGFSLFLTNSAWQKIREALLSSTDVFVSPAGVGAASISVAWVKPAAYSSPVSGETYTAERWTTYHPELTLPPKERVAVSSSRIVLLISEHDLQERTTAEDLAAYLNAIENVVDTFFTRLEATTNLELTIQLALTAAGHEVRFIAVPNLREHVAEDLHQRLESVLSPKVGGLVKLDFILGVRGATSKQ
jgi:enamine deaminase RidA (YjgF/YER057c/UK114 family)